MSLIKAQPNGQNKCCKVCWYVALVRYYVPDMLNFVSLRFNSTLVNVWLYLGTKTTQLLFRKDCVLA